MNRAHDTARIDATSAGAEAEARPEVDEFDLRDLALPTPDADGRGRPHRTDDPFGVLGLAGIESPSRSSALATLLGEAAPVPADRAVDRRRTTTAAAAAAADAMPTTLDDGPVARAAIALLDRLHEEFVSVVRDPTRLAGRTDWEDAPVSGDAPAPPPDDAGAPSARVPLLSGIVRSRRPIDEVLDTFDPLDQAPSIDLPARPDVLHLFAPELARGVRAPLPGLTRREHHALSPDSPMPLLAAREGQGEGA